MSKYRRYTLRQTRQLPLGISRSFYSGKFLVSNYTTSLAFDNKQGSFNMGPKCSFGWMRKIRVWTMEIKLPPHYLHAKIQLQTCYSSENMVWQSK